MKPLFVALALLAAVSCSRHTAALQDGAKDAGAGADTTAAAAGEKQAPWYDRSYLRYEDHTYRPFIRTPMLHIAGDPLTFPLLELRGTNRLTLSFDDLEGGVKNYLYAFIHCDVRWQPSGLPENEYLDGFPGNRIASYRFSFNTLARYTHYELFFPNEEVKLTKSGNYILRVFPEGQPDSTVLTRRFVVAERLVSIVHDLRRATLLDDRNYKQEIDFTVHHSGYDIADPFGSLHVTLMQNGRWDNAIGGLKPLFVKDAELVYDHDRDNVFPGGNEYRFFDIRSMRYQSERIRRITQDSSGYRVYLYNDEKRSFRRYFSQPDINGLFVPGVQEGRDPATDADYVYVHFTLPMDGPVGGGALYVFGACSQWGYRDEFRMTWDAEKMAYTANVLLKQGYYNYEYIFVKDGSSAGDNTLIEGMHYETENNYTILLYHRPPGFYYDRLIGYKMFNTVRKL